MKRKKNRQDFRNSLADRRQAIQGGDRLVARADALVLDSTTDPKRGRQTLREAALFYEGAARAYQRASLGLLAKKHWGRAQDCYEQLNDSLLVTRSQEQIDAIDDIWVGDDTNQI
jgi:hypothetical protein